MSHSRRLSLEPAIDSITGRFRDLQRDDDVNKPDFRELDLGSPVSTLMPRGSASSSAAATPTSSSGSSGSASGKPSVSSQMAKRLDYGYKSHSGEISIPGSGMPTTRNLKPGHRISSSAGTPLIFSGEDRGERSDGEERGGGSHVKSRDREKEKVRE